DASRLQCRRPRLRDLGADGNDIAATQLAVDGQIEHRPKNNSSVLPSGAVHSSAAGEKVPICGSTSGPPLREPSTNGSGANQRKYHQANYAFTYRGRVINDSCFGPKGVCRVSFLWRRRLQMDT